MDPNVVCSDCVVFYTQVSVKIVVDARHPTEPRRL